MLHWSVAAHAFVHIFVEQKAVTSTWAKIVNILQVTNVNIYMLSSKPPSQQKNTLSPQKSKNSTHTKSSLISASTQVLSPSSSLCKIIANFMQSDQWNEKRIKKETSRVFCATWLLNSDGTATAAPLCWVAVESPQDCLRCFAHTKNRVHSGSDIQTLFAQVKEIGQKSDIWYQPFSFCGYLSFESESEYYWKLYNTSKTSRKSSDDDEETTPQLFEKRQGVFTCFLFCWLRSIHVTLKG